MGQKMKFAVEDIHLLDTKEIDSSQFSLLRVDAFATGKSLHDTYVSEETLRRTAKSILQKPFVFGIDKRFDDLSTHVDDEVAGGFVPHNANIEFKRLSDGRLSLSCDVLIWKRYSGKLLEYFMRDDKEKGVSVEIEIFESREDPATGLTEILDFVYCAITGLGDMIQSAIPNAKAIMMFSKEFEEDKEKYEKQHFAKYGELDFQIPEQVKNNAKKGLELYKELGRGGTSVALASARYIVKNEKANPEKVRHLSKYFARHINDDLSDKKSNAWVSWMLWGGDEGKNWSISLSKEMDEFDSKKLSYFAEEGEKKQMPYKTMEEVNDAIKGITPSVSLAQANEIAKQADAIGSDKEKNGWAIAISNFKKSHEVQDGKWVKVEKLAFSLTASQIHTILDSCLTETYGEENCRKYWLETYDEELGCAYVHNFEDGKTYCASYTLDKEAKTAVINLDQKHVVIGGGYDAVGENNQEVNLNMANQEEDPKKPEGADEEKKFSYAEIFGMKPEEFANMFAEDDGDEDDVKKKFADAKEEFSNGTNPSAMMAGMYAMMKKMSAKMAKMEDDSKVYMAENEEMKKKFAEVEGKQKEFAVDAFLKELSEKVIIPQDKFAEMKTQSAEFALSELDKWKNNCKAFSFDFEKVKSSDNDEKRIKSYALPFEDVKPTETDDVWATLNK